MQTILIIDDDRDMCLALNDLLKEEGYIPLTVHTGKEGIKSVEEKQPGLVLLDYNLPDTNGMKVLQELKKIDTALPVIMLTAFGEIKTAVEAMKLGAFDYITKPFENDEICLIIKKATHLQELGREVEILRQRLEEKKELSVIVGESQAIKDVYQQIKRVAPTDLTVFLQGESGTGKELVARMIHSDSLRKEKAFITVDCGALPETLIESELFGYEKGAFTGADKTKLDQFELAENGTIFLDEITNLPVPIQAKLLRVIQEKEIQHLGGKKKIAINVRVITASNLPLDKAVKEGRLREDLYYRFNEFSIKLPLLRQRGRDIILLANHFMKEANQKLYKQVKSISPEALILLEKYPWPGNVRELKNAIRCAVLLADKIILPEHFQINLPDITIPSEKADLTKMKPVSLKKTSNKLVETAEKKTIQEILSNTNYHRGETAKILGIGYRTLYNKMKKYGL